MALLSGKDLLEMGFKQGPIFKEIFEAIKDCKSREEAIQIAESLRPPKKSPKKEKKEWHPDSAFAWLTHIHDLLPPTREGNGLGTPSRNEMRRWLESGSIQINGKRPKPQDLLEFPLWEIIFFPEGRRVTWLTRDC